jgi:outer membrane protein OmpA-like peptidoglycan-associated protein
MRCIALLVATTAVAHADGTQLGAFVGPRIFAKDQMLGHLPDAPAHPSLNNSVMFGGRVAHPLFPWLVPELELALSPTKTSAEAGASAASVFWIDPRVHLRFQFRADERLQPFVVIGGGAPIAVSSARMTFDSGIVGSGYVGGGVRFDTNRNFLLRFDARVAFVPGSRWVSNDDSGQYVEAEIDIGLGIEFQLGRRAKPATVKEGRVAADDTDGDGIANAKDACVDRAEDADGFDDLDGCPDIDNDSDTVLDIADKCGTVPESYNGFQDQDGCPDTVPADVDTLRGTIEGLLYADAETAVRDSAVPSLQKIAKVMAAHPSIRVVLVGHTDDREAQQFVQPAGEGEAASDVAQVALDLSRARAEAVRQVLAGNGVAEGRVVVDGRGADEPVADNSTPKGRLANRRVEIKLYVPPR